MKHTLVFISLYCSLADFLRKANFFQISIFKGTGQLYREAVDIKKMSVTKKHTFCKIRLWKQGPWICVFHL
jgi:hypothetical protein